MSEQPLNRELLREAGEHLGTFMAMRYGSLHHLSLRVLEALKADKAEGVQPPPTCPECGEAVTRAGCVTCADGW